MDDNIKKEIMKKLDTIKFGKITIELNEKASGVKIITEEQELYFKKKTAFDIEKENTIKNIKHEG